jgi:Carboxypeptidase regulatory-like domain
MHLPIPRRFILLSTLVAFGPVIQAQVTTGAYFVQVNDRSSGQPLKNATITLSSSALFQSRIHKVDERGLAHAVLLPVGNYVAEITAPGYRSARVVDVRIGVGANMSQTVDLIPISGGDVSVTVFAASADVDAGIDFADAEADQ